MLRARLSALGIVGGPALIPGYVETVCGCAPAIATALAKGSILSADATPAVDARSTKHWRCL